MQNLYHFDCYKLRYIYLLTGQRFNKHSSFVCFLQLNFLAIISKL